MISHAHGPGFARRRRAVVMRADYAPGKYRPRLHFTAPGMRAGTTTRHITPRNAAARKDLRIQEAPTMSLLAQASAFDDAVIRRRPGMLATLPAAFQRYASGCFY